ncbi:MAG: hypothetical protein ACOCXA_05590, partial [Planctomycetota bacterium]
YEAWDATGLYRVNTSPVFDLNGVLVEGLDVNIATSEELTIDLYIADGVYVEDQQVPDSVGLGANMTYATDMYTIDVDLGIDMDGVDATPLDDTDDETESIIGVNINGDYSAIENVVLFGDFAYRAIDEISSMGFMIGGNYAFNETVSGTLMISYVDPNDDGDDDEIMEIAVAALTNPTGDSNFGINYELSYQTVADDYLRATEGVNEDAENRVGVFVEFLAVIP